MHWSLITIALTLGLLCRYGLGRSSFDRPPILGSPPLPDHPDRPPSPPYPWGQANLSFSLPPLLLISTAGAILLMGHHGHMWGMPVTALPCLAAQLFLAWGAITLAQSLWHEKKLLDWVNTLPQISLLPTAQHPPYTAHVWNTERPFAAQVGIAQPRLLLSQGLLTQLSPEQLETVLAHEQGHLYYGDLRWFFGWQWLRRWTGWLPGTDRLWDTLLLWRECRADAHAAQRVDPLVLAETLVQVVQSQQDPDMAQVGWVGFAPQGEMGRLEIRIQALLQNPQAPQAPRFMPLSWWLLTVTIALIPLGTIAFHHMAH